MTPRHSRAPSRSLTLPGVILGMGMGGFVDGIMLHQVLQWHHMVSSVEPPTTILGLQRNTLADGLFHAFTWVAVALGLAALWARVRRSEHAWSSRELTGWALLGWGVFNLADGVVNHHLLGLHHVRDDLGAPLSWDLGFLALGGALVVVGWRISRRPVR